MLDQVADRDRFTGVILQEVKRGGNFGVVHGNDIERRVTTRNGSTSSRRGLLRVTRPRDRGRIIRSSKAVFGIRDMRLLLYTYLIQSRVPPAISHRAILVLLCAIAL
jgi:hypothetical protein